LEATEFLRAVKVPHGNRGVTQGAHVAEQTRWEKPLSGWVKINFDGGLDKRTKTSGLVIVIGNPRYSKSRNSEKCRERYQKRKKM